MTTSTTDYMRFNVPRGKASTPRLGQWSDGATAVLAANAETDAYLYLSRLRMSMNNDFYTSGTGILDTPSADTLYMHYPNSLISGGLATVSFTSVRELASYFDSFEGDSTVGFWAVKKFDPPIKLASTTYFRIWVGNADYTLADATLAFVPNTSLIEFHYDGWLISTDDD